MPRAVLLLAAATRALAQTGTPGLATYATTLGPSPSFVDPYKSASYASGVANAAIKTGLAGKTFRVAASYYDLSAGATGGTYEVDALSWVTPSPAALTAFAALPVGSALLLNKSDVTGTGPCLLNLICAQYNCTIQYYWPKFPPTLANATDAAVRITYLLQSLGLDLAANPVTMTNTRQQFFRLSSPFQYYNYVVLTTPPVPKEKTLQERIWFWTTPFSPGLWGILFASIFFSSVFVFILEGIGKYSDHLGEGGKKAAKVVLHELSDGVLKNAMSLTSMGDQEAESVPGRVFGAVKALMIWICMASYLANLAATLANVPPPFQLITGFDSFGQYGLPMCIRGISTYISAMTALYPGVTQQVVVGATTGTSTAVDVVAAIQSGQCAGAVLTDVDARYALNQGDPSGLYCTVSVVGTPTSSVFYYAYAFTPNSTAVPDSVVTAFSTAVDNSINSIAYDNTCSSTFLPVDRPASGPCALTLAKLAASSSSSTVAALTPTDLAGLFAVIGMGAAVAILMAFMKLAFKATRARLFRPASEGDDDHKRGPGPRGACFAGARAVSPDDKSRYSVTLDYDEAW